MYTHEFTLILEVPAEVAEDPRSDAALDLSDALYEAGCDDGSLGVSCGIWEISFHRKAENMTAAIRSAIPQVESTGCRVLKVVSPEQACFDRMNEELANPEPAEAAAG